MRAYLDLTKPRLTLMALMTALCGYCMGAYTAISVRRLAAMLLGTVLIGAGANALNQVLERRRDARMQRTCARPLPSGRLSPSRAAIFGLVAAVGGTALLWARIGALVAILGAATLVSYLLFYTPLKHRTPMNTLVGALPGALPMVMGYAASSGHLDGEALALFMLMYLWQLPHFLAIAWIYRADYLSGGFKMAGAFDDAGRDTGRLIAAASLGAVGASFGPVAAGAAGLTYLFMAIFAGAILVGFSLAMAAHRLAEARPFVAMSILYLFALNITLIVDKV